MWECGNLETWLQKMWDILWKSMDSSISFWSWSWLVKARQLLQFFSPDGQITFCWFVCLFSFWQFWPFRRQYLTILKVGYKASLESRLLKKPNCQKRTIVTKILCRRLLSSVQPVKDDGQCSTLEYLTDVGDVVFEGTGVEWMVGCVYSEAWNKHGKASVSNHKPKTYTQTGG